jgi:hypothetical protein
MANVDRRPPKSAVTEAPPPALEGVAPAAAAENSSAPSQVVPAIELVEAYLNTQGAKLASQTKQVISLAGQMAEANDQPLLTTESFLFALVQLGRESFDSPTKLLADTVLEKNDEGYSKMLLNYTRGTAPPARPDEARRTVQSMTANVKKALADASQWERESGSAELRTASLLLALLQNERAQFSTYLVRLEVEPQIIADQLKAESLPPRKPPGTAENREAPSHGWIAGFRNDSPLLAAEDYLDIGNEVRAFAYLAASRHIEPPLSIGLFGEWGSGKTFFMERLYDKIEKIQDAKSLYASSHQFHSKIVQIRFNAWHYIESNLWASLVEFIFHELDRWLRNEGKQSEEIEGLFESLETSKQLRLDAVQELLASKKAQKDAQDELARAREEHDRALEERSRPSDVWKSAASAFFDSSKDELNKAARDLGVEHLQDSATDLAQLVKDARAETSRTKLLVHALARRLGSKTLLGIVIVAFGVALGAGALYNWLSTVPSFSWITNINSGLLVLAGFVSSFVAGARLLLDRAIQGVRILDRLRERLDKQVEEKAGEERQAMKGAQAKLSAAQQAISAAQTRLEIATAAAAASEQEYLSDSARGRLNRFIRAKVADGTYAKHLGIIATVRKDFEQLAQIMGETRTGEGESPDLDRARDMYKNKLEALLDAYDNRNTKLLSDDLVDELKKDVKVENMRFFTRIVLYIDDLDRCPPSKVAEVLQAIHLLLFFPLFVVIVAVDARWIARSLETEFLHQLQPSKDKQEADVRPRGAPGAEAEARRPDEADVKGSMKATGQTATAQDYLEKIFQIPFWVRRMEGQTSSQFVEKLARLSGASPVANKIGPAVHTRSAVPETAEAVKDEQPPPVVPPGPHLPPSREDSPAQVETLTFNETEIKVMKALAPFAGGSPRRAKRFVNLYHILKTHFAEQLARDKSGIFERALIASLAIVTGAPYSASECFQQLVTAEERAANTYPALTVVADRLPKPESGSRQFDLSALIGELVAINKEDKVPVSPEMTRSLCNCSRIALRYSFELWN